MQPEEKIEVLQETTVDDFPEISITELEDEVLASIMEFTTSRKVTTNVAINALMNTYIHILSLSQNGPEMVDTILQHSRAIVNILLQKIIDNSKNPLSDQPSA